jgi:hypothetical protein
LEGQAITVVASGFLTPENNSNGAEFGLFVATVDGGELVELPVFTSTNEFEEISAFNFYPNPAQDQINLNYEIRNAGEVNVEIYNLVGAKVYENYLGRQMSGFNNQEINVSDLTEGIYLMRLTVNNSPLTKKIIISR